MKGYTLVEVAVVGAILASLALVVGVVYVAVHFIAKFW